MSTPTLSAAAIILLAGSSLITQTVDGEAVVTSRYILDDTGQRSGSIAGSWCLVLGL